MAVDHNEFADRVYRHNFGHPTRRWNVAGVKARQLRALSASLWWMSPPCQPFTVRGQQRDVDDPRCEALLHLLTLIAEVVPQHIGFENVPAFEGSLAHQQLLRTLEGAGYHWQERLLCHSALGVPNKRRRYFLVASQDPMAPWREPPRVDMPLTNYLDLEPDGDLYLDQALIDRFGTALPVCDLADPWPDTFCFTSAYGNSPVYAGSYLRDSVGIRHFSPAEITRLHHFPAGFTLPTDLDRRRAYKLVGNSLPVLSVREILRPILEAS